MASMKKTFKLEIRLESLGVGEKGELYLRELMNEYIRELKFDLSNDQGITMDIFNKNEVFVSILLDDTSVK
jgi:hypothetical protein